MWVHVTERIIFGILVCGNVLVVKFLQRLFRSNNCVGHTDIFRELVGWVRGQAKLDWLLSPQRCTSGFGGRENEVLVGPTT